MRILVISDSHRRGAVVERILRQQPTAAEVFFLGDVTEDIEGLQTVFPEHVFHIVSGNCDFFSKYPVADTAAVGGKNIFYTHGHTVNVKYGLERLKDTALSRGCEIALYGHTHISQIVYENGLYLVNPGSCAEARNGQNSYAVIDLLPNGILPAIITL